MKIHYKNIFQINGYRLLFLILGHFLKFRLKLTQFLSFEGHPKNLGLSFKHPVTYLHDFFFNGLVKILKTNESIFIF